MPIKRRVCVHLTSGQIADLRSLSEYTGISQAELFRRGTNYWLQTEVLNEVLPIISGHFGMRSGGTQGA